MVGHHGLEFFSLGDEGKFEIFAVLEYFNRNDLPIIFSKTSDDASLIIKK